MGFIRFVLAKRAMFLFLSGALFIAGGTGIAPLRAMLHEALRAGWTRIGVAYSVRSADEFAYLDELRTLERAGRIALTLTVTRDAAAPRWDGHTGRFTAADLAPMLDRDGRTLCFVCGPQSLVKEMPARLVEQGVPRSLVRIEEWG